MTPSGAASVPTVVGVALASALVPLNSTMIAVALPRIADDFDISKGHAAILITVYLVAMLVGQPIAGRLSDVVGARRLALASLVGFAVCSSMAMVPSGFVVLVVIRAGQAVFASALSPSVQAMLRAITPPEQRGRTFGLLGSVIGVGAALGPVVGGTVTGLFGWRAVFAVNLPIVAVAIVVLARGVPAVRAPAERAPGVHQVDIVVSVMLAVTVEDSGRGTGLILMVALTGCVAAVGAAGGLPGRNLAVRR